MIGKLKGIVDEVGEEELILDVGGVGYLVAASARTLRALPAVGQAATLFVETHVREDAIRLYGFLTASERDWFRLLQSVQGVGAKVALGVLGTLSGEAISAAIAHQDKAAMAIAPGVGPKLAARIVHELKDKAPAFGVADLGGAIAGEAGSKLPRAAEDATLALVGLGYGRPQAAIAVGRALRALRRRSADGGADQGRAEGAGAVKNERDSWRLACGRRLQACDRDLGGLHSHNSQSVATAALATRSRACLHSERRRRVVDRSADPRGVDRPCSRRGRRRLSGSQ